MSDLETVKKKIIPRLEAAHYGQQDTVTMLMQPNGLPFHLEVGEVPGPDIDQDPEVNLNITPDDIQVIRANSDKFCDWIRELAERLCNNIPMQVDLIHQSERSVTFIIQAAEGYRI